MAERVLQGKVALVTGASGGIGGACARAYAAAGASLILVGRQTRALGALAEEFNASGAAALAAPLDVTDYNAVVAAVGEALAVFSRIDILVNCAGDQGPGAPVWQVDPATWRRAVEVNLWGTFTLCRAVLPGMVQRRWGRVINVASGAGLHPMPFFSGYSASKAAVIHFTRTIAEELKPTGVTANALGVRGLTRMWQDVLEAGPGGGATTERIRAEYAGGMRPHVDENVPVFVFLASDAGRHVTGQYLEANSLPDYLLAPAKLEGETPV
jgi:NAD(P)-dependent dehydrogenase (short-subunit alcohol dehydrogenase family)